MWTKNSEKNSRCFSHWILSIELFNFQFRALWVPKLRRYFTTSSVRIAFFTLWTWFLEQHMDQKFWKKSQIFLLVVSINGVSFISFHWKTENETTKTPNWRTGEITFRWSGKSANVGLFYMCLQLPECAVQLPRQTLFFCNTVLSLYYLDRAFYTNFSQMCANCCYWNSR